MKNIKKVPNEVKMNLNFFDEILLLIFKGFSYKIYCYGMKIGYNWSELGKKLKNENR